MCKNTINPTGNDLARFYMTAMSNTQRDGFMFKHTAITAFRHRVECLRHRAFKWSEMVMLSAPLSFTLNQLCWQREGGSSQRALMPGSLVLGWLPNWDQPELFCLTAGGLSTLIEKKKTQRSKNAIDTVSKEGKNVHNLSVFTSCYLIAWL